MTNLPYLPETPSQTAGPYVHIGLIPNQAGFDIFANNFGGDIAGPDVAGERITIEGRIIDASGNAARDVLVETWQANAAGRYTHPSDRQDKPLDKNFRGWARTGTDFETGIYRIKTIKPGQVAGRRGRKTMAPHISFWIAARGINTGLSTRMYFADEASANADDPVLNIIEPAARRQTLIAARAIRDGGAVYTFDIHLGGERETVFFDV